MIRAIETIIILVALGSFVMILINIFPNFKNNLRNNLKNKLFLCTVVQCFLMMTFCSYDIFFSAIFPMSEENGLHFLHYMLNENNDISRVFLIQEINYLDPNNSDSLETKDISELKSILQDKSKKHKEDISSLFKLINNLKQDIQSLNMVLDSSPRNSNQLRFELEEKKEMYKESYIQKKEMEISDRKNIENTEKKMMDKLNTLVHRQVLKFSYSLIIFIISPIIIFGSTILSMLHSKIHSPNAKENGTSQEELFSKLQTLEDKLTAISNQSNDPIGNLGSLIYSMNCINYLFVIGLSFITKTGLNGTNVLATLFVFGQSLCILKALSVKKNPFISKFIQQANDWICSEQNPDIYLPYIKAYIRELKTQKSNHQSIEETLGHSLFLGIGLTFFTLITTMLTDKSKEFLFGNFETFASLWDLALQAMIILLVATNVVLFVSNFRALNPLPFQKMKLDAKINAYQYLDDKISQTNSRGKEI